MEHKIVMSVQPFDIYQDLKVIDDKGAVVHTTNTSLQTLTKTVKALSKDFSINEVIIQGSHSYLEKFKNEMITEFDNNPIKITII